MFCLKATSSTIWISGHFLVLIFRVKKMVIWENKVINCHLNWWFQRPVMRKEMEKVGGEKEQRWGGRDFFLLRLDRIRRSRRGEGIWLCAERVAWGTSRRDEFSALDERGLCGADWSKKVNPLLEMLGRGGREKQVSESKIVQWRRRLG